MSGPPYWPTTLTTPNSAWVAESDRHQTQQYLGQAMCLAQYTNIFKKLYMFVFLDSTYFEKKEIYKSYGWNLGLIWKKNQIHACELKQHRKIQNNWNWNWNGHVGC
jgi:hypothetical protein